MRILFATSEIAPWVKTGGLGDVSGALPQALRDLGEDVRVLIPGYGPLLDAFPDRVRLADITHPAGSFPPSVLHEAHTKAGLPLLIVQCPTLYERPGGPYQNAAGVDWPDNYLRFGMLSKTAALLASSASPLAWRPQILHCHDWQTALAPAYAHYRLPGAAATVMTIHNLSFLGVFPATTLTALDIPSYAMSMHGVEFHGSLSFLKAGLQLANRVTTVSPTYAREIQTPEFGNGLDGLLRHRAADLTGILNGIDEVWNPATDSTLAQQYDIERLALKADNKRALQQRLGLKVDAKVPLFVVVSRLTPQKGLDLLAEIGDELAARGAQLALLGSGERNMQDAFVALGARYPNRIAVVIGYDELLAHQLEAGGDIFLMPSRFEPCGLNQMYSLRYGTPPIVRDTGGLADTVIDTHAHTIDAGTANGFVFHDATAAALLETIDRAIAAWHDKALWRQIQRAGMEADLTWRHSAAEYRTLYRSLASEQ